MSKNLRTLIESIEISTDHTFSSGMWRHYSEVMELRSLSGGPPLIGSIVNSNCVAVATTFFVYYVNGRPMAQIPWQLGGAEYISDHLYRLGMSFADEDYVPGQCVRHTFEGCLVHRNLNVRDVWRLLIQVCINNLHRVFIIGGVHISSGFFDYHRSQPCHGNHAFNIVVRDRRVKIIDVRSGSVIVFSHMESADQRAAHEDYFIYCMSTWQTFYLYEACA